MLGKRCALTPSALRNLRTLPLKMSSFIIASFAAPNARSAAPCRTKPSVGAPAVLNHSRTLSQGDRGAPCNGSLNFTEPTLGFFARFPVSNETRVYPNGSQVDQGVARKAQPEPEGEMEETETPADPEAPLFLIR